MSFDIEELTKAITLHGRVARVVIVDVKGSTPREIGASMLVWDGGQSGTIGGGALEFEAAKRALNGSQIETVPLGPSLGQCCGGSVVLATEIFEAIPEVHDHYTRLVNGLREKPFAIIRQEAAARQGQPRKLIYQDGWLSEPVNSVQTPLWIYGAGHVGRALVNVLEPLPDFEITWVDTARERFPTTIPQSVNVLPAQDIALTVRHAPSDAIHLVLTYSHAIDLELCHQLLTHGFAFAGLIGSKTKWARFGSRLEMLGHSKAQISRITCPIGDPNLGKHPQEIAVGVATSLMSRRSTASLGKDRAN